MRTSPSAFDACTPVIFRHVNSDESFHYGLPFGGNDLENAQYDVPQYDVHRTVDCKGLSCPLPVVKAKKAIDEIPAGEVLEVLATDPGSVKDVPGWARRVGHDFLETVQDGKVYRHYIRKAEKGGQMT
jgi:TusA-related sulfurtransferase